MSTTNYIKKVVLNEIKKSQHTNLVNSTGELGIYVLYIWVARFNNFLFKIGETRDITKRIIQLNGTYESAGKIILVFYGKKNRSVEKFFHNRLKKFNILMDDNVSTDINNLKVRPRELYNISPVCNEQIISLFESKFKNNFFESKEYELNDDGTQYIELKPDELPYYDDSEITINYDDENPENNNKPYLILNSNSYEKCWKIKTRNVHKYKEDDGEADQDDNDDKDSVEEVVESDFNPNDESDDELDKETVVDSDEETDFDSDESEESDFDSDDSDDIIVDKIDNIIVDKIIDLTIILNNNIINKVIDLTDDSDDDKIVDSDDDKIVDSDDESCIDSITPVYKRRRIN
jgi:hypothetical protein